MPKPLCVPCALRTEAVISQATRRNARKIPTFFPLKCRLSRRSDGGFPPDDRSSDGFSMEITALMALVCQTLDLKDESAQALSAVYRFQLGDGGIPEANTASLSDASGRIYTNLPRTSAAAWYAIAAAGYNPFVP